MTANPNQPFDPPRNGRGQYLIPNPDGKPQAHTRMTTWVKALDDQTNLIKWQGRMVALGLTNRPDLLALAAATDPDNKTALNKIAADAADAGGASTGRNMGSAIHAAAETYAHGADVPALFDAHIGHYIQALADADLELVDGLTERVIVHPDLKVAGTFDQGLRHKASGTLYVADIKTGSLGFPHSFAAQLAGYATAPVMLTSDYSQQVDAPPFDETRGIVVHIFADGTGCTLHWIDLQAGYDAFLLAGQIRGWRATKDLLTPMGSSSEVQSSVIPRTATEVAAPPTRLDWFNTRYQTILETVSRDEIAAGWPDGLPGPKQAAPWTDEQLEQALTAVGQIEDDHELPFPPSDPTAPAHQPRTVTTAPQPAAVLPSPSSITAAPAEQVDTLKTRFGALNEEDRQQVMEWQWQGQQAGRPWHLGTGRVSDLTLAHAAVAIGLVHDPDPRNVLAFHIPDNVGRQIGALIGSLTEIQTNQILNQIDNHKGKP